jgi:DNA-binding winged helix-turn-helix (wHTH) protein
MPQAPDELRAKWDDDRAIKYLEKRGYKLTKHWTWILPTPNHQITDEEDSAIAYLVFEWDFGGIEK